MIILGDCIEQIQKLQDNSVDNAIIDLPYGVTANKKDIVIPFDLLWEQLDRVVKDNGTVALFAQGLFYVDLVNSNRKNFRYDIVWDKVLTSGFLDSKRKPLRQHEQIAIFQTPKTNNL
jgi:site-specific DNA-methyltransferase (adenine-specific)